MKGKFILFRKDRPLDALNKPNLKRMLISRKTYQEIADIYGVTKQAIRAHAFKLDLHELKRNILNKRRDKILRLFGQGTAPVEIAKKCGLDLSQCYRIING